MIQDEEPKRDNELEEEGEEPTTNKIIKEFPIESPHPNQIKNSLLDGKRKVPSHVLAKNIEIANKREYCVHGGTVISLIDIVNNMQQSVVVYGGHIKNDYKKLMLNYSNVVYKNNLPRYPTLIRIINQDCLDCSIRVKNQTQRVPLLLNLAQRWIEHVCGAWHNSFSGSQEEVIERRTAVYRLGLDPKLNQKFEQLLCNGNNGIIPEFHIPKFGVVFLSGVPIIRDRNWRFYGEPCCIDVAAAGGIDLRKIQILRHGERGEYYENAYIGQVKLKDVLFRKHTKYKMRAILAAAVLQGKEDLILGALGCGAFQNPPEIVAECWREVLEEDHFKGMFKNVIFAVLGGCYDIFTKYFQPLDDYSNLIK